LPPVKSAIRVCQLLNTLATQASLTHTETAQQLAMPKSSVTALLATLEAEHFVQRDPTGRRFLLGSQVLALAHRYIANLDLARLGQPVVDALVAQTGESAALSIVSGSDILVVAKANCQQPLQRTMQLGERAPMHATAAGKAILAFLPPAEIERVVSPRNLSSVKSSAIRGKRALLRELEGIRAGHVAYSREELIQGITALGAPAFGFNGAPVAALSVAVPSVRFSAKHEASIANAVTKAAETLSHQLGYSSTHKSMSKRIA
jgi:DNA-binding IclR family transcriptional regulator